MVEPAIEGQIPSPGGPIYHLQEYYYRLALGDRTNIARTFRGLPLIVDPRFGEVKDWPGYEAYISSSAAWLARVRARFTPCESTLSTARHILEGRLHLEYRDPPEVILVVLVGEVFAGGMKHLRIYHSLDATDLSPRPRAPLAPNPGSILPESIAQFIRALASGQAELAREAFALDARLVSPNATDLGDYFRAFGEHGAESWQVCSLTYSGYRHALEYNLTQPEYLHPTAGGCAVFELAPEGRIQRLRIYPVSGE